MSKEELKTLKAFNFDLDTKKLETVYSVQTGKFPNTAYNDLKRFFKSKGFEWRQGSGYISTEPISSAKVATIIREATKKLPWLSDCVNKFDVTDITAQHDLTDLIKRDKTPPTKKQKRESVLGAIKTIKAEQSKEQKTAPQKTKSQKRSKENEI